MKKNNIKFTKDFGESLSYAGVFSIQENKKSIEADEIFLGIYEYLKSYEFFKLFWKMLGFNDTEVIEKYKHNRYGKKDLGEFELVDINMELDTLLSKKISELYSSGLSKIDFLALLLVSFINLSESFKKYLELNGIKLSIVEKTMMKLLKNKSLQKTGIINFFNILGRVLNTLNLDKDQINMFLKLEKIDDIKIEDFADLQEIQNLGPQDLADGGLEDIKTNYSKIENTDPENKKLTIEHIGIDLTKEAEQGYLDPVIGRDLELKQVIYTLLRKTKNNPLLLGEAGVGKTAIIELLAQKIVDGAVPNKLKNKRIFTLDMGSLLAGTKYRGEFEARFKSILDEAADETNNIILFIDEIHTVVGAGNQEGSADVANMLKPLLSRGKLQLMGATTFDEYQKHIEKDPALKRRFQELFVNEPNFSDAIEILKGIKSNFENFHNVNISNEAISACVSMSYRYILDKFLPDKAIDLLDEACARKSTLTSKLKNDDKFVKLEKQLLKVQNSIERAIEKQDYFGAAELKEKEESLKREIKQLRSNNSLPKHLRKTVECDDIGKVLSDKLGIPVDQITNSEITKLKNLDKLLSDKLLGQEDTIKNIVDSIKRNRLSVIQKDKPIASFLFLGPSGVGKTYIAKLLASDFFGDPKSLTRVDMSEFMEKHSASKLIGSAPGYVGYDEGGVLTEAVRRKPYSVILFDEIEKASKDVLNVLLQILDEGVLKDNKGRLINFKNTIIILTSNIGSEEFQNTVSKIGFNTLENKENNDFEDVKKKILDDIKTYLTPELINRLDYINVFNPLGKEILTKIFDMQIKLFLRHWKNKKGVELPKFNKRKIGEIIDTIYEPQYGARPVSKYINNEIEPKLIEQLINNS